MRRLALLVLVLLALPMLASCTVGTMQTPGRPPPREVPDLATLFDCLRHNRLALVSAHRGQADPDAAENALSSFRETLKKGPILIELDIARTADGALVLMHDETLDRTTTGTGRVAATTFEALRRLSLKTPAGEALPERVPSLDEALVLAGRNGVILQLDLKRGVAQKDVIDAVRHARMERQVILIAYSRADAETAMKLAPGIMVSASGRTPAETAALLKRGGPRMLVFTGTSEPAPALLARLDAARVEAITGTLGRPGTRLDDRYMADGDGREYAELAARGVALIASDRPAEAWDALEDADRDGTICLTGEAK
jgi:glycerophosphoryl diester phosphodiesterase